MKVRWVVSLVMALALVGCDQGAKSDVDAGKAPPRLIWKGNKLTLESMPGEATFLMSGGGRDDKPLRVNAIFVDFAVGSTLSIGTHTGAASSSGEYRVSVDVRDAVGKQAVSDAVGAKVDFGLEVGITLPGHRPTRTKLPALDIAASLASALAAVPTGGVRFAGEPAADGPARSVAVLGPKSAKRAIRVLGPAKQVWDIDWVAIEERLDTGREKRCGGYRRRIDVKLRMIDSRIQLYDRRRGTALEDKAFEAPSQCPDRPLLNPDGTSLAYVLPKDVDAWLRERLGLDKK